MSDIAPLDSTQLLKRLSTLLYQNIDARLKPFDLARTQYVVLYHLYHDPKVSTGELAERMQVEPATLSGIAATLVAKGLIKRTDDATDRRRKNLRLTSEGSDLFAQIPPPRPVMEEILARGIPPRDVAAFKKTGYKMLENLYDELNRQEEG